MSSDKEGKFRMSIPKKEEDINIEEEHEHEEHEHHHEHEVISDENYEILLLNAIAHSLSHVESSLGSINNNLKLMLTYLENLRTSINSLTKVFLLQEVKDQDMRRKLLSEILDSITQ
ncbi:MAG: hypothetical protein B7O98_05600 [Zestosphaera tikiterensis]|uniref:Uncharacterized protein n=1 Tax=Zestosphaera tikiterensis TaxID=1973259 RepID=A0A2R7Y463_9CREN|nr:MAG: hypothetical protein B7O98_05600 [Zestosphaera tikiterensis]